MAYGQLIYRRRSGIYVARIIFPVKLRDRVLRREVHVSTQHRSRAAALVVASEIVLCWRRAFEDLERLDAVKIAEGSPVLSCPARG